MEQNLPSALYWLDDLHPTPLRGIWEKNRQSLWPFDGLRGSIALESGDATGAPHFSIWKLLFHSNNNDPSHNRHHIKVKCKEHILSTVLN